MPKKREKAYRGLKDATFMGIMRDTLLDRMKTELPGAPIEKTVGAATKGVRESIGMRKSHINDAFCIAGNLKAERINETWFMRPVRSHNRRIHKDTICKGGYRKLNQAPKYVFGFQLFDKARMPDGKEGFVFGRRSSGSFKVQTLSDEVLSAGISHKKLKPLEKRQNILVERRSGSSPRLKAGVSDA
jgi:N6-L-threonylcarbamoyladenine synthase